MTINIIQDNTRQESLGANGANLIHSLSELAQTPGNTVTLRGNISSLIAYEDDVDYLNTEYGPDFIVNTTTKYVFFEDDNAQRLCAKYFGDGIGCTRQQLASANVDKYVDGTKFADAIAGANIAKFNEFKYFTSVTNIPYGMFTNARTIGELTLPPTVTTISSYGFSSTGADSLQSGCVLHGTENVTTVQEYGLNAAKGYTLNFNIYSGRYINNGYGQSEIKNCINEYIILPHINILNLTSSSTFQLNCLRNTTTLVVREDFVCDNLEVKGYGNNGYSIPPNNSIVNLCFLSQNPPYQSINVWFGPNNIYVPDSAISNYSIQGRTISGLSTFANILEKNKDILLEAGCTITGSGLGSYIVKAPGES